MFKAITAYILYIIIINIIYKGLIISYSDKKEFVSEVTLLYKHRKISLLIAGWIPKTKEAQ